MPKSARRAKARRGTIGWRPVTAATAAVVMGVLLLGATTPISAAEQPPHDPQAVIVHRGDIQLVSLPPTPGGAAASVPMGGHDLDGALASNWETAFTSSSTSLRVSAVSANGARLLLARDPGVFVRETATGLETRVDVHADGSPLPTGQVWSSTISADGTTVALVLAPVSSTSQPRLRIVRVGTANNFEVTLPDPGRQRWASGAIEQCWNQTNMGPIHLTDDGTVAWMATSPCYRRHLLALDVSSPSLHWMYRDAVAGGAREVTGNGRYWVVSWDFCEDLDWDGACGPSDPRHSQFYRWDVAFDDQDSAPNSGTLDWPGCFFNLCGVQLPPGLKVHADSGGQRFAVMHPDVALDPDTVVYTAAPAQLYWVDWSEGRPHYLGPADTTDDSAFRIAGDGRSVMHRRADSSTRRTEISTGERIDFPDVPLSAADPYLGTAWRAVAIVDAGGTPTGTAVQRLPVSQVPHGLRVAVIGDSYISGEGAGSYIDDTDVHSPVDARNLCHRASTSWAYRVALRLAAYDPANVLFRACSGARTHNVLDGQYNETGDHTQLAELRRFAAAGGVDVVFVSLGGNDAGFSDIVKSCLMRACLTSGWKSDRMQDVRHAATQVRNALTMIKAAAPGATVFLTGYPSIVDPADGTCAALGLTEAQQFALTAVPGNAGLVAAAAGLRVDRAEQEWLNATLLPTLNQYLSMAATEAGTRFIDPAGWFSGHQICSDRPYGWGLRAGDDAPESRPVLGNEGFHPTVAGHAELAMRIERSRATSLQPGGNPPPVPAGLTDPGPANEVGAIVVDGQVHAWGDSGHVTVQGMPDGTQVVLGMYSSPIRLGDATSSAGAASVPFSVPTGIAPGLHTLVLYKADGTVLATEPVNLSLPDSCTASNGRNDRDKDAVADACDTDLADGPAADSDGDGLANSVDDCPTVADSGQSDIDGNGIGDACDPDHGYRPVAALQPAGTDPGQPVNITVERFGSAVGTVTVDGVTDWACADRACAWYDKRDVAVTLHANAEPGTTFLGWAGDCTGTGPCLTTAAGTSVIARFTTLAPDVIAVYPSTGSTQGGYQVRVTGFGLSAATGVTVDGSPVPVIEGDDYQLRVSVPPHGPGPVAIGVTTPLGADTEPGAFTYEEYGFPPFPSPYPSPTTSTAPIPGQVPGAGGTSPEGGPLEGSAPQAAPGPTRGVALRAAAPRKARLTWRPPTAGGAAARYVARSRAKAPDGRWSAWRSRSTRGTSLVLAAKVRGSRIQATVRAVNAAGSGPASSVLSVRLRRR